MELSPIGGAFDSAEVRRLTKAFERSWDALKFAFDDPNLPEPRAIREALASRILELSQQSERDAAWLAGQALASLPPYAARWTRPEQDPPKIVRVASRASDGAREASEAGTREGWGAAIVRRALT
jgi:hypothetical protein